MLTDQGPDAERQSDAWFVQQSLVERSFFTELFDRHVAALYRYARGRIGADVVDDVVSETFLAAFRRRRGYDESRPDARPWLFGILTKEISHHRRRERAHYRAKTRYGPTGVEPDCADRAVERAAAHGRLRLKTGSAGVDRPQADSGAVSWKTPRGPPTKLALSPPMRRQGGPRPSIGRGFDSSREDQRSRITSSCGASVNPIGPSCRYVGEGIDGCLKEAGVRRVVGRAVHAG